MRRFFIAHIPDQELFELPEEESKHIVRVLRMNVGDMCLLLNGKGLVVEAEITDAHPKRCGVKVVRKEQKERSKNGFHLAIAPTKNMDRMEWLVEKIVEVGAQKITFLQGDHSERVNMKYDRLERVAISAMKQAKHDFLLEIGPIISVEAFIKENPNARIAHCEEREKVAIQNSTNNGPVMIGPEGDFSTREIDLALSNGCEAVSLGDARLRTETAGLVAVVLGLI